MKTVVLNFTQPSCKEVFVLLAPDDMDVQAEIAECRTRSNRSSFSRECRSATVCNWLIDRGCRYTDEPPVMIDGWHEPPMTRPRSENCNVPLVEPYIRIGDEQNETATPAEVSLAELDPPPVTGNLRHPNGIRPPFPGELSQEEVDMAFRSPVRTETVPNNIYQTVPPIEWRPFARNMEIAVEPGDMLYESPGSDATQPIHPWNPVSWTWSDEFVGLDEMRAASLSHPPTTRDQDQQ